MRKLFFVLLISMISSQSYSQNDSIMKATMQDKANNFFLAKDYEGAAETYTKMSIVFPDDLEIIHNRGVMYMMSNNYNNAITDFTKLINSNYKDAGKYYYFRAMCKTAHHINGCEDLVKAKMLGYNIEGANFKLICPDLNKN